jgi:flagellar biosynthetic protein FliR
MLDFRDVDTILNHGLAFLRVGGIIFALPVLGDQPVPVVARVILSAAITASISHMIPANPVLPAGSEALMLGAIVAKELVLGIAIGYLARIAFDGLLMAASMVGYQMGFGTASLFIQDAGQQMDTFTSFHRVIMMTIFLMLDLHHLFIDAIQTTFALLPLGKLSISIAPLAKTVLDTSGLIFKVALQLGAPVLVALMFTQAALGLVARAVPQLNVFVISFPLSFAIGLVVYVATLPFFPEWMREHYIGTRDSFNIAIRTMSSIR